MSPPEWRRRSRRARRNRVAAALLVCLFIVGQNKNQPASSVSSFQVARQHVPVPFGKRRRQQHWGTTTPLTSHHNPNGWSEISESSFPDEMCEFGFFGDDDFVDDEGIDDPDEYYNDENNGLVLETSMYDSQPSYSILNLDDLTVPYVSRLDSESTFVEYTEDGICIPARGVGKLKEEIANILKTPSVEIIIATVVILNSALVAVSTLDSMDGFVPAIRVAENFVVTIFCADFFGRWFSSSRPPGRFVLDSQFVVDVVVVILPVVVGLVPASVLDHSIPFLPSALSRPSGLFNLQLLRVLRLRRVLQDLDTFERFAERALGKYNVKKNIVQDWQLQLARVLLTLFTLVSVSTGLIYTAENAVNPKIDNYFDALYFGLTTLTTVGFGDITPVTGQGRLVVCGSILFGIAVVPAQGAALLEALLDREQAKKDGMNARRNSKATRSSIALANRGRSREGRKDDTNEILSLDTTTACPQCGASFHWASARYCHACGAEL